MNRDTDVSATGRSVDGAPLKEALSSVTTPILVACTGLMYFAGYFRRDTRLRYFGLIGNGFDESFQATVAFGFTVFIATAIVLGLVLLISRAVIKIFLSVSRKAKPSREHRTFFRLVRAALNSLLQLRAGSAIALFLIVASAGMITGFIEAWTIKLAVTHGLHYTYVVGDQKFDGLAVDEDQEHIAIYTSEGVLRVFPVDTVHIIYLARPTPGG